MRDRITHYLWSTGSDWKFLSRLGISIVTGIQPHCESACPRAYGIFSPVIWGWMAILFKDTRAENYKMSTEERNTKKHVIFVTPHPSLHTWLLLLQISGLRYPNPSSSKAFASLPYFFHI